MSSTQSGARIERHSPQLGRLRAPFSLPARRNLCYINGMTVHWVAAGMSESTADYPRLRAAEFPGPVSPRDQAALKAIRR